MSPTVDAHADAVLDQTLMALAHPARRAIVRRLSRGPARVTELAAPFAMSLNAVSKHILVLERAHLVTRRRQGREHVLTFDPAPLDAATTWISTQRAIWNARLDALAALLEAQDAASLAADTSANAGPTNGTGLAMLDLRDARNRTDDGAASPRRTRGSAP